MSVVDENAVETNAGTPHTEEVVEQTEEEALAEELRLLDAVRASNLAEPAAKRKVERLKREVADKRALIEAEGEHGEAFVVGSGDELNGRKLAAVHTDGGLVILRRPELVHFRAWKKSKMEDEDSLRMIKECLVYPDRRGFNAIVDEFPGTILRCEHACGTLAGARFGELLGK